MFNRLRRKIIITNTVLFGILVLGLLGTVYGLAYTHMSLEVNEHLEKALIKAREIDFEFPELLQEIGFEPNSLIVIITLPEKDVAYKTGGMPHNDDFLKAMINDIMKDPKASGRSNINSRHLASNVSYDLNNNDLVRIVVYDYTILNKSINTLLYILLGAYVISILSLVFILTVYADKAIKPIEQAFYRQRELVANASHELKTPLTIIDTNITALNTYQKESIEKNKKWFDNISTQSQRMSYLINDMLELAKADSLSDSMNFEPINISHILMGVLLSVEAGIFENGIIINSDVQDNIIINANRDIVEKLLYILVDNAIKYTPKKGAIDINLHADKRKCLLRIKNTGSGIPKEKIEKLFERFYRADESHSQGSTNSFGLGLAIAKSIVDSLGASIRVESIENEYTEFIVAFKTIQTGLWGLFKRRKLKKE